MANVTIPDEQIAEYSAVGSVPLDDWESPSQAEMQLSSPFSNKQVNLAGDALANIKQSSDSLIIKIIGGVLAIGVVDSWRSTHAYPLRVVATFLRRYAKMSDSSATVSRRLKRMESIIAKLQRYPNMALTQMQDIGGCRAILESIQQVNALREYYKSNIQPGLEQTRENDYINEPKEDGYRGIHLVVRFQPKPKFNAPARRIEIQIRTRLQHQWATAVETVDLFTKQTLKTGGGNPKWKRFFALTASLFAAKENCPLVPGTQITIPGLVDEAYDLWRELQARQLLIGWMVATTSMMHNASSQERDSMYLVELDTEKGYTLVNPYPPARVSEAQSEYAEKEKESALYPARSVVLVSVDSINDLKAAYPSYYGDTSGFLRELGSVLALNGKPLI